MTSESKCSVQNRNVNANSTGSLTTITRNWKRLMWQHDLFAVTRPQFICSPKSIVTTFGSVVLIIVTKSSSLNGTSQSEVLFTVSCQKIHGSFVSVEKSMNGSIYLDYVNWFGYAIDPLPYFHYRPSGKRESRSSLKMTREQGVEERVTKKRLSVEMTVEKMQ